MDDAETTLLGSAFQILAARNARLLIVDTLKRGYSKMVGSSRSESSPSWPDTSATWVSGPSYHGTVPWSKLRCVLKSFWSSF